VARKKEKRFVLNQVLDNVLEEKKPLYDIIKGKWNELVFKKPNPLVLELGCGKGEYTVGLARIFPDFNFIGIDIKGDRIAVGAKTATDEGLTNVAFLRTKIHNLEDFFGANEVSEIWVTFPDPQPLEGGIKRRLTNPRFLAMYRNVLIEGGTLHLKTDSEPFFDYSVESLKQMGVKNFISTKDLYNSEYNDRHHGIKTRFEEIFTAKGFKINYLATAFATQN
jgi:tRNA (guanine-N7-)-methyltransferase